MTRIRWKWKNIFCSIRCFFYIKTQLIRIIYAHWKLHKHLINNHWKPFHVLIMFQGLITTFNMGFRDPKWFSNYMYPAFKFRLFHLFSTFKFMMCYEILIVLCIDTCRSRLQITLIVTWNKYNIMSSRCLKIMRCSIMSSASTNW